MNRQIFIPTALFILLSITTLTAVPASAQEDSFRCSGYLVSVGALMSDVVAKCGPPTAKEPGQGEGGATWIYNRGSGQFTVILRFVGPTLSSIEQTDQYGSDS